MSEIVRTVTSLRPQNLGTSERWVSGLSGLVLLLAAARRGGPLSRVALSATALSLLTRGATGYCAVKGAISGETSLTNGLREQWHRISSGITGAAAIDSMESMYLQELQELHSAEQQFTALAQRLATLIDQRDVALSIDEYAVELQSRASELRRLLSDVGADPREHPDQAMQGLINETLKMAQVCARNVRDAALLASMQRIIHYKIAGYGTIAAYAKALNRNDEAGRFAELADHDKAVDAQLTELAKSSLNPQAVAARAVTTGKTRH